MITSPQVEIAGDEQEWLARALAHVRTLHDRAIAERGRFVMALTGGSTPRPLHRALAHVDWIQWSSTHVFFGDERAVPAEHPASNVGQANVDLLDHVERTNGLQKSHIHRLDGGAADLDGVVAAYETSLAECCDGRLDLLFVGLGNDAHILSLHPGATLLSNPHTDSRPWFVVLRNPPMNPPLSRLTATPSLVRRARSAIALVSSAQKAEALRAALEDADDPSRVPAHILRQIPALTWIADRDAAKRLRRH